MYLLNIKCLLLHSEHILRCKLCVINNHKNFNFFSLIPLFMSGFEDATGRNWYFCGGSLIASQATLSMRLYLAQRDKLLEIFVFVFCWKSGNDLQAYVGLELELLSDSVH